jgi:hypothetical protein
MSIGVIIAIAAGIAVALGCGVAFALFAAGKNKK